jgi:hypothetical protein
MNRVLFLSDKSTDNVLQWLEFMHGFKPDHVIDVTNVRQYAQNEVADSTVFHLNQPPLTLASNAPADRFLEIMANPPYNLHNPWLKQFDAILVTYYDVSKNDRFIIQVK